MKKLLLFTFALASTFALAQDYGEGHEELNQRLDAFIADNLEGFELEEFNLSPPDFGDIEETDYTYYREFMLKSEERSESNLGRNQYQKLYVNAFGYYDESERDYAMKEWLADFIDGQSVRPGRDKRRYEYAHPMVVIINEDHIVILNYECAWDSYDYFNEWREKMFTYFSDSESVIMEVRCEGPLEWTRNRPDSSDRTWR